MSDRYSTRPAPPDMRLPVPRYVQLAAALLGVATIILGLSYALFPPRRLPALQRKSVVAAVEQPLGWVLVTLGVAVVVTVLVGHARASVLAVTAVAHAVYLFAGAATVVIAYPLQSPAVVALGLISTIALGGASVEFWSRGYR